jgi:hypothetical protein
VTTFKSGFVLFCDQGKTVKKQALGHRELASSFNLEKRADEAWGKF